VRLPSLKRLFFPGLGLVALLLGWRLFGPRDLVGAKKWGDIGGLEICDARAALERRPQTDKMGCFVRIPAGAFLQGAQSADPAGPNYDPAAEADEGPPRRVQLPEYFLQKEEVSVGQFEQCVSAGACAAAEVVPGSGYFTYGPARPMHPVNGVSWRGATAYCAWVGARLPSESEWEFAARGPDARRYPWGDAEPTCDHAVLRDFRGRGCGQDSPRQVNDHPKIDETQHMLLHMAGNVWEWVDDWYAEDWYARAPAGSPAGPPSGERRVQRGGGWTDEALTLRASLRGALDPDARLDDVGFRCAAEPAAFRWIDRVRAR
jgi:iron(II)-dependent oxidoreductase